MEAQLKGAVLIALLVVPQWRCPFLKPLSAKLPPNSETMPPIQDGRMVQFYNRAINLHKYYSLGLGTFLSSEHHFHWKRVE